MANLSIPRVFGEITPSWLTQALNSTGALGSVSVTGFAAETIAQGTGFMNQLFRLQLQYDSDALDQPRSVMVKLPSVDPLLRRVFEGLGQNLCEVRFYQEMATNRHLAIPRLYYGAADSATGDTVLVLEDLSYARQGDSLSGCSLAEAQRVITRVAEFQASWWDSPQLDELDWMPLGDAEAHAYGELYVDSWPGLMEKAGEGMPQGLRQLGDRLQSELSKLKAMLAKPPRTIVHGDFRLDNCFFPAKAESQWPVVFDWEFCVRGRGVFDVATFIAETFPVDQRRREELGLLRLYHSVLTENGVRGYSFDACLHDYRLSMLEIFVFWIVSGGHCNYDGDRATQYLRNSLERFDAAIADHASIDLLS